MPSGYKKNGMYAGKIIKKKEHLSPNTEFKKGQNLGVNHPKWKGGKVINAAGYIFIYSPKHAFCNSTNYVLEHRLVVEKQISRYLAKKEIVHHINGIRDDNRIENLILFKNGAYHFWYHKKGFCNPKGIIFDGRHL